MSVGVAGPGVPDGPSVLTVEPGPEYAAPVRVFAAAVGRTLALDEERIEDLKLVLTEVCANASEATEPTALRVRIEREQGGVAITCTGAGLPLSSGSEAGHREGLVRALAPDLHWSDDGIVRFTVPL